MRILYRIPSGTTNKMVISMVGIMLDMAIPFRFSLVFALGS